MGRGWHSGWCGSWCHNGDRIFDSACSEIMKYRIWAVVGIAVGKIGYGQRLAWWLVMRWLLMPKMSSYSILHSRNHTNSNKRIIVYYVGPQIGMNPKPILRLPDLETDLGSPRVDAKTILLFH